MATDALAADEPSGTTDVSNDDKRVLDLGDVEPASIPGATVIFATAYTRTDDGAALRYDGDVPIAAVGVYSEIDAREALEAEYDPANIDRAFRVGEWLDSEKPARATAAVSCVESAVATDGGAVIAEDDTPTDDNVCAPCHRCESYERVDAITAENHMVCAECSRTGGSR